MTTKLKIRLYGDSCLRQECSLVKEVGVSERHLIAAMVKAMHDNKGVGLAAPQVGINEQIIVVDIGDGPMAFINPQILKSSGSEKLEEGCLSIPGVMVDVKRPKKIKLKYIDVDNNEITCECADLLARVIQHETDHLHGKLIIDYASSEEVEKIKPQLDELKKQSES